MLSANNGSHAAGIQYRSVVNGSKATDERIGGF
jgi:hypothetical protein